MSRGIARSASCGKCGQSAVHDLGKGTDTSGSVRLWSVGCLAFALLGGGVVAAWLSSGLCVVADGRLFGCCLVAIWLRIGRLVPASRLPDGLTALTAHSWVWIWNWRLCFRRTLCAATNLGDELDRWLDLGRRRLAPR